jgi:GNAT superfamily N-acetyltransferase
LADRLRQISAEGGPRPRGGPRISGFSGDLGARLRASGANNRVDSMAHSSLSSVTSGFSVEQMSDIWRSNASTDSGGGSSDGFDLFDSLKKLTTGVLDLVDTPRAIVTSTVKEVGDIFDASEGTDFSISDLIQQSRDNIGFGEVIEEWAPGLGEIEVFGVHPLDNIAGFMGEVLLDPFTYLTLGSLPAARQGARGLAALAFRAGDAELGRRALRGVHRLADDDFVRLTRHAVDLGEDATDLRGGLRLTLPGTGNVSQRIGRAAGVDISARSVKILPQSAVKFTPRGVGLEVLAKMKLPEHSLLRAIGGDRADLKRRLFSGSAEEAGAAFHAMDATNLGRGKEHGFDQVVARKVRETKRMAEAEGVDGVTLYNASGMSSKPDGMSQGLYEQLRETNDFIQEQMNEWAEAPGWIKHRKDWQPAVNPTFLDWLTESRKSAPSGGLRFDLDAFEIEADLVAGKDFLGERLVSSTEYEQINKLTPGTGKTPRQQAQDIYNAKYAENGDEILDWFVDDWNVAIDHHVRQAGRRVNAKYVEQHLLRTGVAVETAKEVIDSKAWNTMMDNALTEGRQRRAHFRVEQAKAAEAAAQRTTAEAVGAQHGTTLAMNLANGRLNLAEAALRKLPESRLMGYEDIADDLAQHATNVRRSINTIFEDSFAAMATLDEEITRLETLGADMATSARDLNEGLLAMRRRSAELLEESGEIYARGQEQVEELSSVFQNQHQLQTDMADLDHLIAGQEATLNKIIEVDQAEMAVGAEQLDALADAYNGPIDELSDYINLMELAAVTEGELGAAGRKAARTGRSTTRPRRIVAAELPETEGAQRALAPDVTSQNAALRGWEARTGIPWQGGRGIVVARGERDRLVMLQNRQRMAASNLRTEAISALQVGTQNLKDLRVWRGEIDDQLTALVQANPEAFQIAALEQTLLDIDPRGVLRYDDNEVWIHGGSVDATPEYAFEENASLFGTNVLRQGDGSAPVGADPVAVRVRAESPVVFAPEPGRQLDGTARREAGVEELHAEMFDYAVRTGRIDMTRGLPTRQERVSLAGVPAAEPVPPQLATVMRRGVNDALPDNPGMHTVRRDDGTMLVGLRQSDGKVSGFVVVSDDAIDLIEVGSAFRGKGIGTALLNRVQAEGFNIEALARNSQLTSDGRGLAEAYLNRGVVAQQVVRDLEAGVRPRDVMRSIKGGSLEGMHDGIHDVLSPTGSNAIDGRTRRSVTEAFRNNLLAQGHDSIAVSVGTGSHHWHVIPLDQRQVEFAVNTGDVEGLIRQMDVSTQRAAADGLKEVASPRGGEPLKDVAKIAKRIDTNFEQAEKAVIELIDGGVPAADAAARLTSVRNNMTSTIASDRCSHTATSG